MRSMLCAVLVAAACTPGDQARTPGAASPTQKYAGTWEGRAFHSETDTGTPFRIVSSVAQDGTLRGTLTFLSFTAPPIPVRARAVNRSAITCTRTVGCATRLSYHAGCAGAPPRDATTT